MGKLGNFLISALVFFLVVSAATAEEENDCGYSADVNSAKALKYKIIAIFSTLIFGVLGVCWPIFALDHAVTFHRSFCPNGCWVIAMNCVTYLLPVAREILESSCTGDSPPWGDFPMTEVVVMACAILTMIESTYFASAFTNTSHEGENKNGDQIHLGHSIRQKLVTQVLELGTALHLVIIGASLGASPLGPAPIMEPFQKIITVETLIVAISFHQLIQGFCRGACISQAKLGLKKSLVMVVAFSLTTPVGIGIGIGLAEICYQYGPTMLMVSGFLNAAAAGILLYVVCVTDDTSLGPPSRFRVFKALFYVFLLMAVPLCLGIGRD